MIRTSRRGFTLVELLVVVGIIAVLVGLLMAVVNRAVDHANSVKCESNVRTLTGAFLDFAADNDGHLPGSRDSFWGDREPSHWDWLFGPYSTLEYYTNPQTGTFYTLTEKSQYAPQSGTIWKYVSRGDPYDIQGTGKAIYRCPSVPTQKSGGGVGSNGRFDYYAFACWNGAKLSNIKAYSRLYFPLDKRNPSLLPDSDSTSISGQNGYSTHFENWPTPLIAQEDALIWSNTYMDTWGEYCRQMAHVHSGGCYYGSIDRSVRFIIEPDTDPSIVFKEGTSLWYQEGPLSGVPKCLNFDPGGYNVNTINVSVYTSGWDYWSHE